MRLYIFDVEERYEKNDEVTGWSASDEATSLEGMLQTQGYHPGGQEGLPGVQELSGLCGYNDQQDEISSTPLQHGVRSVS